jgi:uncharacterized protein YecT (DUF1311 family)
MLSGCGLSFAQYSAQFEACMAKAMSQTAMNACAGGEDRRADAELNTVYQKVLSAARAQPSAVENIRKMERAWIAYRDAYLGAMYPAADKQAEYGSVYPMNVGLVRARLTYKQIDELRALIEEYVGPK